MLLFYHKLSQRSIVLFSLLTIFVFGVKIRKITIIKEVMQMKTQKLTAMSILLALVIILQLFATFIPMKPFNLNLTLIPIVVGAALYGKKSGALLGFHLPWLL